MSDGLDINILTGRAKEIAAEVDNKNVKDGKLSEKEISVFLAECEKNGIEASKEPWYSKCSELLSKNWDNLKGMVKSQLALQNNDVAVRDATYVAPAPEVALMKQEEAKRAEAKETEVSSLPKPLKLGARSNIRTNYEWSEEEFEKVLDQMLNAPRYKGKFKNSVLKGKAKAFIEAGKKFNIDPRILVAISMCESQRGISETSIDSIAKTVNTRYQEGFTTASKIAHSGKYCAKHAAASWLSDVNSYIGFFDKYYKDEN